VLSDEEALLAAAEPPLPTGADLPPPDPV
jgi:hypothetical protein